MSAETRPSTTEPIRIEYTRQADGVTYGLDVLSRERIRHAFPHAQPSDRTVFVSFDTQDDFEQQHGSIWMQIAMIVTGLTRSQLDSLGGIRLVDPVSGRELAVPA